MAKPGDIITDAEGTKWRATQGGNWRAENGPNKGKLYKGKGDPVAAPAAAATPATPAVSATTPIGLDTAPPVQLSPDGKAFLDDTKAQLQKQVQSGGINQSQADFEYARREQEVLGLSPALQAERWRQQQQVNQGQISQQAADTNVYNSQYSENQTAPNLGTNLTPETSAFKDVINTGFDVAKGASQAGNVLSNPNEVNDFGQKKITIDPTTGAPTVTTTLSDPNKQVLSGVQGNAVSASDVLNQLIKSGYGNFLNAAGPQQSYSDPALEEAVFNRLTSRFGDEKARGREQVEQTLANRGIPVGSEAYSNVTRDFENTWNDRYDAAKQEAVIQGTNTALQRQGNNISGLNSFVSGLNTLGAIGQSGLYQPNFQSFNATPYNQPSVENVFGELMNKYLTEKGYTVQQQLQDDAQAYQKEQTAGVGGGGGGGGGGGSAPRLKAAPFASSIPGS